MEKKERKKMYILAAHIQPPPFAHIKDNFVGTCFPASRLGPWSALEGTEYFGKGFYPKKT